MWHPEADQGYRARDWLIRVNAPIWLERVGLDADAQVLRELDPVVDEPSTDEAEAPVRAALERVALRLTRRQGVAPPDDVRRLILDEVADEAVAESGWRVAWATVARTVGFRSDIQLDEVGNLVRHPHRRDPVRTARYAARNAAYLAIWDLVWAASRADGRAAARAELAPTVGRLQSLAAACFSRTSST